jgi:hypothetical protein
MEGLPKKGLLRIAVAVAAGALVFVAVSHAQGTPDAQALVVAQPAPTPPTFTGTGGDFTWPALAGYAVNRFLTVIERMVTDTRAWLDRVLDVTKGRIKVDYRKTNIQTWAEDDPERTGPIRMNRRRDDPGRNGAPDQ